MNIYNIKIPKGFYIYAYFRDKDSNISKAGTPYYIGKGSGKRAWASHSIGIPKKNWQIVILEQNLSEIGAFALERRYIRWYGRVDNETGILRNLTDGGEGPYGCIKSVETRLKQHKAQVGKKKSPEHCEKIKLINVGRKHSPEQNKAKSDLAKRLGTKPPTGSGKDNPFYGRHHTEEYKRRMSEIAKSRPKPSRESIDKRIETQKKNQLAGKVHANKGKKRSQESINKGNATFKKNQEGKVHFNTGKIPSMETNIKRSKTLKRTFLIKTFKHYCLSIYS
jgi:hypothetical protein